jgi:hypothetical protein
VGVSGDGASQALGDIDQAREVVVVGGVVAVVSTMTTLHRLTPTTDQHRSQPRERLLRGMGREEGASHGDRVSGLAQVQVPRQGTSSVTEVGIRLMEAYLAEVLQAQMWGACLVAGGIMLVREAQGQVQVLPIHLLGKKAQALGPPTDVEIQFVGRRVVAAEGLFS